MDVFVLVGGREAEQWEARFRPLQSIPLEAVGIQPLQVEEGLPLLWNENYSRLKQTSFKNKSVHVYMETMSIGNTGCCTSTIKNMEFKCGDTKSSLKTRSLKPYNLTENDPYL